MIDLHRVADKIDNTKDKDKSSELTMSILSTSKSSPSRSKTSITNSYKESNESEICQPSKSETL